MRPSATSSATRLRRTATSANSEATKNPLARTRQTTAARPRATHVVSSKKDIPPFGCDQSEAKQDFGVPPIGGLGHPAESQYPSGVSWIRTMVRSTKLRLGIA